MSSPVVVSNVVHDLPEEGESWLLNMQGEVLAKFYNGQMVTSVPVGNLDETKEAA